MKFLCGVARGLLIVTPSWLDHCKSAGKFIGQCSMFIHPSGFIVDPVICFWSGFGSTFFISSLRSTVSYANKILTEQHTMYLKSSHTMYTAVTAKRQKCSLIIIIIIIIIIIQNLYSAQIQAKLESEALV